MDVMGLGLLTDGCDGTGFACGKTFLLMEPCCFVLGLLFQSRHEVVVIGRVYRHMTVVYLMDLLCVCVYAHALGYMCVCIIHVHVWMCMCVCMCVCICASVHICVYVCMHMHALVPTCISVCVCVHAHVCIGAFMHKCVCVHARYLVDMFNKAPAKLPSLAQHYESCGSWVCGRLAYRPPTEHPNNSIDSPSVQSQSELAALLAVWDTQ